MSGGINWKRKASVQLRLIEKMTNHLKMIQKAVEIQVIDAEIWHTSDETYVQQQLLWLHRVIEEGDAEAFENIIKQSKGDV